MMMIGHYIRRIKVNVMMAWVIMCLFAACGEQDKASLNDSPDSYSEENQILDEILYNVENSSGTIEGIQYAQELYDVAKRYDRQEFCNYALVQKLSCLHALGRYTECIALADSLDEHTNIRNENLTYYYLALYIKSAANVDLGKYKTAIQLAQRIYDESKVPLIDEQGNDISLFVKCNALMSLGLANDEMGRQSDAIEYFTEGINSLLSGDKEGKHLSQLLEIQTARMMAGRKVKDKRKALSYVVHYKHELDEFNRKKVGTFFDDVFVEDYSLFMYASFIDTYTELERFSDAQMSVNSADSLLSKYEFAEQSVAELNSSKAHFYAALGDYDRSIEYADSAMTYFAANDRRTGEIEMLKTKLNVCHMMGLLKSEYPLSQRIISLSDSIYHDRIDSQIEDMQTVLEVDKLEREADVMRAQRQMWVFIAISVFLLSMTILIFFKRKKEMDEKRILSSQKEMLQREVERQTKQLRDQNEEIEKANEDLAQKNTQIQKQNNEITESIVYAQFIQNSILPNLDWFKGFGDGGCFAFFEPSHIVSGDFYWARKKGNLEIFICADCTGHGVPGAFMTMIGTTIIGDLCDHSNITEPAKLLENLHLNLISVLQQNGEVKSTDGMDLSVVVFDSSKGLISVASAKRPVFLYHNGVGEELDGVKVKRSIGDRDYNSQNRPFVQQSFEVVPGDTLYMFSDGMTDIFGGDGIRPRRFGSANIKKMMDELIKLPLGGQRSHVEQTFTNWMSQGGTLPREDWDQPDDVSFIGLRF